MIRLQSAGYTHDNFEKLRDILKKGLSALMLTGKGVCTDYVDCEECVNYYLCKDLDSTINWLDKKLNSEKTSRS